MSSITAMQNGKTSVSLNTGAGTLGAQTLEEMTVSTSRPSREPGAASGRDESYERMETRDMDLP